MKFVFVEEPERFDPQIEVVACIFWYQGKVLSLLRNQDKMEGGKWGFVAGKVDRGEDLKYALKREVYEEIGVKLTGSEYKKLFYVRYPDLDFLFHAFEVKFSTLPQLRLKTDENRRFQWLAPEEFLERSVVNGNKEIFSYLYLC